MITKHNTVSLLLALYLLSLPAFGQQAADANLLKPYATGQRLYDQYPNAILIYYGLTGNNSLLEMLVGQFNRYPEQLGSIEYSHTLSEENAVRRFFSPLVGVVQLAVNVAVRAGKYEDTIYEVDPYIGFRWANWPWNHYVNTSFALAEGVSYTTAVPSIEKRRNDNTKRFLNYVVVEATFAPPRNPRLQLVARIHHRSGAFGLYRAGNTGSNVFGLGLRYLFD